MIGQDGIDPETDDAPGGIPAWVGYAWPTLIAAGLIAALWELVAG